MVNPKISIVLPIHNMLNGEYFLWRAIQSILSQRYRNYEIVITQDGKMAENTNSGIKRATGDIIKILYMDDYFAHPEALQRIAEAFTGGWLVTGCTHTRDGEITFNDHTPTYSDNMSQGNNTIGSPSVLAFENIDPLFFDEKLSWLLDGDLYERLYERYGLPTFLNDINVIMGIGEHQMTYQLTSQEKDEEFIYVTAKHL